MKSIQIVAVVLIAISSAACSKIPSAYRGNFQDNASGTKLSLSATKGTLLFANGRTLEAGAEDVSYDGLLSGKGGIYVRQNSQNPALVEVFWVNPNLASKQSVQGFVWYESEVIYMLLDSGKKDKVSGIHFFQCLNGTVVLDEPTKSFQAGCPANPTQYDMVRVD